MERNKKKQEWTPQEIQLLNELQSHFASKKWKRISEEFRERGFIRSEIECREKWINFLDPRIKKTQWEDWELQRLYDIHGQVGTRWCVIQKELSRTQNKIKNKFYGTIRNYIRFVLGYFDSTRTCYNTEISKLSPTFLNDLYSSQKQFAFMAGEPKNAIYDMKFTIEKKIMAQRIRLHRPIYSRMQQTIFSAFQNIQSPPPSLRESQEPSNRNIPDEVQPQQTQIKREENQQLIAMPNQERVQRPYNIGTPYLIGTSSMQVPAVSFPIIYWFT